MIVLSTTGLRGYSFKEVCMANSIVTNPMVLNETGLILDSPAAIKSIVWTDIATNGDDLIIRNKNGGAVVYQVKGIAGEDLIFTPATPLRPSGIYLDTLSSGKVLL